MNPSFTKTFQIFAVAVFAFIIGGWSFLLSGACVEFRAGGGTGAWLALVCAIAGLAVCMFALIRDAWRRAA